MNLLEVNDLKVYYNVGDQGFFTKKTVELKAVDGVTFSLKKGEVLGIVGESGCGKSTLAKAVMELVPVKSGEINLLGKNLQDMNKRELKEYRKHFQMIFQDPEASLNPRMTVGDIIGEPIGVFFPEKSKKEIQVEVLSLMKKVGLNPDMIRRYPHEFSGGQRQRICIARSLSTKPELVVCDEAVSALDVSIQAQILNLLNDLKKENNLSYLFISHDLAVTRYISDYIMVMYLGKVVEYGPAEEIISNPQHPYTKALISSVPEFEKKDVRQILEGELPSPVNPPSGCSFRTRCPFVTDECSKVTPQLKSVGEEHTIACIL